MKMAACAVALVMFSLDVGAQQPVGVEQLKPYIQVKTVAGDEFTVRAFFSPSCSYSKQYMGFFNNLMNTLPDSQRFEFTPVVNKGDGVSYAISFLAVKRFYPKYLPNYVQASLIGTQDHGLSPGNWAAIDKFGKAAHIPVPLTKVIDENMEQLQKDLSQAIRVQRDLKITNTPSVSVAGTYIVTPEFTAGNSDQFSSLVNGIISMVTDRR